MSRDFWDTDLFIYLFEDYGMPPRPPEAISC